MSKETLGAVVVGTGFGFLTHMRALREAGIEVRALVGRDPGKTTARAKSGGVPNGITNLDEALALPGVDIVTIATPPHTHAEIAIRACAAGKHVMCEKPFAASLEEGERMLEAAEKAGVVHVLGTEFRFSTGQAVATRAIKEGVVGDPVLATFLLLQPGLADPSGEVPAWWGDAAQGGGWLGAYASHVVDQMRATLGEWSGLSASLGLVADRDWSAEDTFTIHFKTVNGCTGILQSSAGTMGAPAFASRISGKKGTLIIAGDSVSVTDASGARTLETPEELVNPAPNPPDPQHLVTAYDMLHSMGIDIGPFTKLFTHMRDTIQGVPTSNDPAPGTFADGVALQRIMDAIRRSNANDSWEKL
ncbi:MAG: Gfo/Idh/MocA family oxidoreductase [Myxococcota bacterium]|nr:Gfo/Idh/MocA family oxidoreductase [Myxococcota bacterium]